MGPSCAIAQGLSKRRKIAMAAVIAIFLLSLFGRERLSSALPLVLERASTLHIDPMPESCLVVLNIPTVLRAAGSGDIV